ncbi:hypothetical protein ACHWQZ_G002029 [Mnemiopsis leidyi]
MSCVDDIEDLASTVGETPTKRAPRKRVIPKKFSTQLKHESPVAESVIPGTQSVFVRTWGCSHNNSDSEYMAGLLATYGYKITDDAMSADLWLLNSCTVKTPSEDGLRNSITSAHSLGKKVVVAGCVSQGAPDTKFIEGLSIVGVQQIDRVVEVVEETFKGHSVRLFGQKKEGVKKLGGASLHLPKIRKNPLIEIIAINTGCLNQCTYCKTKHARGELGSYPIADIVERGVQSFAEGVREVWMTSEDTGAYGRDIGVTLPDLLYEFVKIIPEGCMLRLGMTNPPYILDYLEDMAVILSHPRVYSFLHVPVQAGTPAARMKKIPADKVKLRTKKASEIFQKQFPYTHKLGELQTILVTEVATDNKHYVGHNKFYDQVLVPKIEGYMGQSLTVKIVETGKHFLKGKVIEEGEIQNIPSSYSNPNKLAFSLNPYNMVQNVKSKSSVWNFLIVLVVGVMFQMLYILYRNHR